MFKLLTLLLFIYRTAYADNQYNSDYPVSFIEQDQAFITRVNTMLPERQEISPIFLESSQEAVFTLGQDTELSTTFLWEGAGFKNSFGYYTIGENNQIERKRITKNASMQGSGGPLKVGDTFNLGSFVAGTTIGFYIKPNGFYRNDNEGHYFYSEESRNVDNIKHVVTSYDNEEQKVVIGFEDLWNGGDKDYNDLIFSIFTSPTQAISSETQNMPDIKGEQILNQADGNVTMSVAKFAKVISIDDITMYPLDLIEQYNVDFKGRGELVVESNCGIIISTDVTSLIDGDNSIATTHLLDNSAYSIITAEAKVHKQKHFIDVFAVIPNILEVENGGFTGTATVTVSPY